MSRISLRGISSSELERFVVVMQGPFPALTDLILMLCSSDEMALVISDSFLGRSTPRLRYLWLDRLLFPALPKLLQVNLRLWNISHSGYISPLTMIICQCLSTLTKLKALSLRFRSPQSRPDRASRLMPALTRIILPALTYFDFKGVTEYLEDFMARIDVPLLEYISITFFNQLVFDILQLPKFLCRTEMLTVLDQAEVAFNEGSISVELFPKRRTVDPPIVTLKISCRQLDWQLSSLVQVCNQALPTLSTVECFKLGPNFYCPRLRSGQDDVENTQWLELLHPLPV